MEESRVLRTCLEDGTVRWRLYNLWVTRPTYLASVYCSVSFALESIKELLHIIINRLRDGLKIPYGTLFCLSIIHKLLRHLTCCAVQRIDPISSSLKVKQSKKELEYEPSYTQSDSRRRCSLI